MSRRKAAIVSAYEKGYRVTDEGLVISPKGKTLSLYAPEEGRRYRKFTIYFEGGPISLDVHRLVGYQKFGDAIFEPGIEVRHLDSDCTNNSIDNIGIGTGSENAYDIPRIHRISRSSTGGYYGGRANRVFSKEKIFEILRRLDEGESKQQVADSVGVVRRTINNIWIGKSYREWFLEYRTP